MPQHQSAKKRVRQTEKKRARNIQKRSKLKTAIKNVKSSANKEKALNELKKTVSILDQMATKNIIHKNKAANLKSKLTQYVNKLS